MTAASGAPEGAPAEVLRELIERVLEACALAGTVEVVEDEESLRATVEGDDLGLLIGRHGQTIDALEHVAVRIAYRNGAAGKRVVVDAAGYRARRRSALERQAERAASDALEFGRPVALDAMPPAERRVVHEYLRDRPELETYSEGDEPDRHLVVAPVVS